MTTITENQYLSLKQCIYESLISLEENGLGEIGDCQDEAERIINEWMEKENIKHSEQPQRPPTLDELKLLMQRQAAMMNLEPDSDEVKDTIDSSKIIVFDYIPDSPGYCGPLIFLSYGAGIDYFEVLTIKDERLIIVDQSEDLRNAFNNEEKFC